VDTVDFTSDAAIGKSALSSQQSVISKGKPRERSGT
jgi:hypothetical protein